MIEMLVVMALIGLLLTIAVPRYFHSLDRARDRMLQKNLSTMRVVLDKFYTDKGRFPNSLDELVSQRYLPAVPLDPVTESRLTWVLAPAPSGRGGIVDVKSGAAGIDYEGRPYGAY